MDDLASSLPSFPSASSHSQEDHDKLAKAYVKKLGVIAPARWTAQYEGGTILETLKPAENSIPYTFALLQSLKEADGKDQQLIALLPYLSGYLRTYNPSQIRYIGKQWRELFTKTVEAYNALNVKEIQPLAIALLRLDPTGSTLTSSHLEFLRLCMSCALPSQAVPVLNKNIYAYPVKVAAQQAGDSDDYDSSVLPQSLSGPIKAEDILEYYITGGMIYTSQRNWVRAQLFFEYAVLYPTPHGSASALQTEAYQKWMLVTLMLDGKPISHSWPTSQQAMKHIKAMAKPYEALAESFLKRDWRKFQAEVDVGEEIWLSAGDRRLVQTVSEALLRYCVLDLQRTFTALPVSRVAEHLSSTADEATQLLTNLIASKQLAARLDTGAAEPTLRFDTVAEPVMDDSVIEAQTARIEELIRQVQDASQRLMLTKEYAESVRKAKRNETDPADQMDLEYTTSQLPMGMGQLPDDDEDIMA